MVTTHHNIIEINVNKFRAVFSMIERDGIKLLKSITAAGVVVPEPDVDPPPEEKQFHGRQIEQEDRD